MNCFTLEYDMNKYEKGGVMAYCGDLYGVDRYAIKKGISIESWDERISFYYEPLEGNIVTDYICNDIRWPIVSDKFKNVMDAMGINGIQYLPIKLINKNDGEKLSNYYVANICNLVEAVDMEQSEHFELRPGRYSFVSYVIKKEKVTNLDIFRLKESNIPIFLSEKLKKTIEDNKLTGFSFRKIKVV